MQRKIIVIISSIIIVIAIIGGLFVGVNTTQYGVDKYAVSSETVISLLQNKEHVLVVDIRSAEQYRTEHLDGAAHDMLDSTTLEKRIITIQKRLPEVESTYNFVLVDNDGIEAKQSAQSMTEKGIQTFYLKGGMNNLSENLVSSTHVVINSEELMKKIAADEDLYLLDVRQPDELLESKIDDAVNIPLAQIFEPNGMNEIPTDKPVVVICGSGNRATIATYALAQEGVNFQVLEGGMKAWNKKIQEQAGM